MRFDIRQRGKTFGDIVAGLIDTDNADNINFAAQGGDITHKVTGTPQRHRFALRYAKRE